MEPRTYVTRRILHSMLALLVAGCAADGPPPQEKRPPVTQPTAAAQQADPSVRFAQGVSYARRGATDQATAVFQALTEDYPELPGPYNNLAVLYASRGRYEEARKVLEQAIRLQPNLDTAHENLGDIHVKLAVTAYQRAVELGDGNRRARSKIEALKLLLHPGVRRDEGVPLTATNAEPDPVSAASPQRDSKAPDTPTVAKGRPASGCHVIGPISDAAQVTRIRDWLQAKGLVVATRQSQTDTAAFYRVHLPPMGSVDEAVREVDRLKAMGVRDLSVIRRGSLQNGVALGAYRQETSVKRRLGELREIGLSPEVEVIKHPQALYWLDLGPSSQPQDWIRPFQEAFPDWHPESTNCKQSERVETAVGRG